MSADNRICIMQDRYGHWAVWNGSASDFYSEPPRYCSYTDHFKTEEEAKEAAFEMHDNASIVEYGVQTITPEEQEEALNMRIQDLQERLKRLKETGCQWDKKNFWES